MWVFGTAVMAAMIRDCGVGGNIPGLIGTTGEGVHYATAAVALPGD